MTKTGQSTFLLSVLCAFSGTLAVAQVAQEIQYEALVKEYLALTRAAAEAKDEKKLLAITDTFERGHRPLLLASVYIWNRDLGTKTNLLFWKRYREVKSAAKIHFGDESKINVAFLSDCIMVTYRPPGKKVSCELIFERFRESESASQSELKYPRTPIATPIPNSHGR